ncbi:hypothetical protein PHMEG_0004779 [Phytophthora megakarya]|uniref:Uncharacterized protein n=1 Tax=Phytophthora megakarya TaxID=4795 RepID=A0A225WSU8_9STRA|nr:hypothetical protein PHMEG_0004779 [Phytophthora megakarya]
MNRIFGAIEAEWSVRVSAGHLAESINFLVDLGSLHCPVPQIMRTVYNGGCSNFSSTPLQTRHDTRTRLHGSSGVRSIIEFSDLHGFLKKS